MTEIVHTPVILSADDDPDAHFLLQRAVARAGVKVTLKFVNDGIEAINYLAGEGQFADRNAFPLPDLLLLDWKMPRVKGSGVLEYIRQRSNLPKLPVIVFSCSDDKKDVSTAQELGCSLYVVKPTKFEELIEFVTALNTSFLKDEQNDATKLISHDASTPQLRSFGRQAPVSPRVHSPAAMNTPNPFQSADLFRFLVEQAKDYAIFALDRDGYIRSWNEGGRRIKGYEPHEIIGQHFSIFYGQQDKDNEKPQFELRMAQEMGRYEEEGWRLRKDKSRFWANVVITPLRDANGELYGFAKVTRDLTQRKLQEESFQRLLDSEERFRLLVEQVRDYAIFILDAKGTIISWNQGARRIKGYSSDEIIGKHFSIFYTADALASDHPAKELTLAIRDGRYEEEGWRLRKDGSRFWASVVITALWDKRGNLTGFAKVTRDLTARKETEDALREKTAELEAFAHTLSHDLRTPLRAVSSFAELLRDESGSLSEQDKLAYLNKIAKAAHSMDTMINHVLQLSQLSSAAFSEDVVPLDAIFDEILALLENEIARTKAQIKIQKPLPTVKANPTLLRQVFSNLISNALKFSANKRVPKIEVFTIEKDGMCEIQVRDNGVGIPSQYHKSIFKPFERGAADSKSSGSGIGLAIVKKAAERLGGHVTVESKEGEGSTFVVTIPCRAHVPLESAS